ncbi:unnamed protein product [Penicillium camemberti]|uniref:Str. FM013 n=1 Tax=Penicillium camemberti (strain FM 013) TaxID=1429867 RepID=A0A0G4PWU0_PENC3|nr:unnamed protein product [Penicillium camemberti]
MSLPYLGTPIGPNDGVGKVNGRVMTKEVNQRTKRHAITRRYSGISRDALIIEMQNNTGQAVISRTFTLISI